MSTIEVREVAIVNKEGLHARPVMRFVELASRFASEIRVRNITRQGEEVDGKSAMHMMLLDAAKGCSLRIEANGADAASAVDALSNLVISGFDMDSPDHTSNS